MRKFLGAISTKTLAIAGVALLIAGGAFFALNGKVSSDPKARIVAALANLGTEFTKTSEDFTPGFGLEKMNKKIYEDGISSMDLNINTTYFAEFGVDKAGVQITTKNIPKDKKSEVDLNLSIGNLAAVNSKLTLIGNNFYVNIPSLYEKALLLNFETLGADLQNEAVTSLLGDSSHLKDLKMDLYAVPLTFNELKKDYAGYIKSELQTLAKNTTIEKVETDKVLTDALTNLGSTKTDLEQFNIKIKSADVKSILLKSIDYYKNLQERQIKGIDLSEMSYEFDYLKNDIENTEFPEELNVRAILSKENLIALSIEGDNKQNLNIYYAGAKNTTDKIVMQLAEETGESEDILNFEMKTGDKNTMTISTIDNEVNFVANYNPSDKTTDMILEVPDTSINVKGKYEDIKEGVGYNFIMDDLTIDSLGEKITLQGNLRISTETPTIETPSQNVEILKSNKEELTAILQAISTNAQANYAPLIMMMSMGGGF